MNETVRYLHEHGHEFGCEFVDVPDSADVIFTNDVFPAEVMGPGKRLVKRMDGIYWQQKLRPRNLIYNQAAQQADHVIIISEYSRRCYEESNTPLKSVSVVTNWADPRTYYPFGDSSGDISMVAAIATDWSREEKNFAAIVEFANRFDVSVVLIGKCEEKCPGNVLAVQYVSNPNEVNYLLNQCDAFINFSINDSCPKVVAQAICVGLPVFYLDSGGVSEMVGECGVGIDDIADIEKGFNTFKARFSELAQRTSQLNKYARFEEMLSGYFCGIKGN